jgi:hypothetical protein
LRSSSRQTSPAVSPIWPTQQTRVSIAMGASISLKGPP